MITTDQTCDTSSPTVAGFKRKPLWFPYHTQIQSAWSWTILSGLWMWLFYPSVGCWCKYNVQTKLRFPALPQALKTRDGLPLLEWPHGSDFKVLVNWESKVLQSCGTKTSASKFSTVGVARVVCKLKQYRIEAFIELFFVIIWYRNYTRANSVYWIYAVFPIK